MANAEKIADHNCAAKLMAALLEEGGKVVSSEAEAIEGAKNDPTHTYICIDMGASGVICIKVPKEGKPVRVRI